PDGKRGRITRAPPRGRGRAREGRDRARSAAIPPYRSTAEFGSGREAVEQAVTTRPLKVLLAAAARCMRRIPGVGTLTAALSVVVTHHRAPLAGRSPVVAGGFRAPRKGSVRRRSGEDIVPIGRIPASVHHLTPFV